MNVKLEVLFDNNQLVVVAKFKYEDDAYLLRDFYNKLDNVVKTYVREL